MKTLNDYSPPSDDPAEASEPQFCVRPPLVLVNGLAEQPETWFRNAPAWRRHFEVYQPNLAAFESDWLHRRIAQRLPVDVSLLVERLREFLDSFVSTPPYRFVANSMGGKIMVEFALRYPDQVERLALICPSGLDSDERLPFVEGVRVRNMNAVVESLFHDQSQVDPAVVAHYQSSLRRKKWRLGWLHLIRGTMGHFVGDRVAQIQCPTLMVVGDQDRIVDPELAIRAAVQLPQAKLVVVPNCGHAPQLERPDYVNRLVIDFMQPQDDSRN